MTIKAVNNKRVRELARKAGKFKHLDGCIVKKKKQYLSSFLGTHWMMELMLLIQQNGRLENVKRHVCLNREFTYALPPDFKTCAVDLLVTCPSPRFYRTHLPCQHLPPQVWKKKSKVRHIFKSHMLPFLFNSSFEALSYHFNIRH